MVGLAQNDGIWLDVAQFRRLIGASRDHGHDATQTCAECLDALTRAADLYRGDFLEGFTLPDSATFDEWQFFQAESLRQDLARALERIVHGHRDRRAYADAIAGARRWVALDPLHEPAQRDLMRLYAESGRHAAAVRQYRECERLLEAELGLRPSDETTALYDQICAAPPQPSGSSRRVQRARHNLPAQVTPFLGREAHLARLRSWLSRPDVRLVTITGAGGTGKTRLAMRLASDCLDRFGDGVFFVTLAPVHEPALVMSTVAATLGIGQASNQPPLEQLKANLADSEMLLVLDNFEHLLEASTAVAELLAAAPRLKVVVTSRSVLHLYGEHVYNLPPMTVPDSHGGRDHDQLTQVESVKLFAQRAAAIAPDFTIGDANAAAIVDICTRLDGLPLAIELAAARVRLMRPQNMAGLLRDDRLGLLTGGSRDQPARQQTLRATIDWSFNLLDENERRLFRRLAVFAGGCDLEAARTVAGEAGDVDALQGLEGLVDKSLLQQSEVAGSMRFTMLETIREYALERLDACDEGPQARRRHARTCADLVDEMAPRLQSWDMAAAADHLQLEHDNLRAALGWSIKNDPELALRLAAGLAEFWRLRNYDSEGREWQARVLARTEACARSLWRLRATVLTDAGRLALRQGDYRDATRLIEESLELWRALGDDHGRAYALLVQGTAVHWQEDYARVHALADECVVLFRNADDRLGLANAYFLLGQSESAKGDLEGTRAAYETCRRLSREGEYLPLLAGATYMAGTVALLEGDYAEARSLCEEAEQTFRGIRMDGGTGWALALLGLIAYAQGDLNSARAHAEESRRLHQRIGSTYALSFELLALGLIALYQEEWDEARRWLIESLAIHREGRIRLGIGWCMTGLAMVSLAEEGDGAQAALLLGTARAALEACTGNWPIVFARIDYERIAPVVQSELPEAAYQAAWSAGYNADIWETADTVLGEYAQQPARAPSGDPR
jgi:predicted ATPase